MMRGQKNMCAELTGTKSEIKPDELKILICCHKKTVLPENELFLPIHVGAAISSENLEMQRDDMLNDMPCDNISSKNKSFCELTAMYWAWKNIKKIYPNIKYIGLNHYRRYFNLNKKFYDSYIRPEEAVSEYSIDVHKLNKILQKNKSIVSNFKVYPYSLDIDYCRCHFSEDIKTLEKIVSELYPDYKNSFNRIIKENNKISPCNMFVLPYDKFESYCEWLFRILFEAERRINIENYNDMQKRIFGYMAERLLNVWIYHNSIKVKHLPVSMYVNNTKQLSITKYSRMLVKSNISFSLMIGIKNSLKYLFKPF